MMLMPKYWVSYPLKNDVMIKLIEFLFFRWKKEIYKRGEEEWQKSYLGHNIPDSEYRRSFVDYKYTNKFDGSTKIKRKYLN